MDPEAKGGGGEVRAACRLPKFEGVHHTLLYCVSVAHILFPARRHMYTGTHEHMYRVPGT